MSIRDRFSLFFVALCLAPSGCGHDPIEEVVAKLRDPNVDVRRAAAHSLVVQPVNDERLIAALAKDTSDRDSEVRFESVEALGKLGPPAKSSLPLIALRLQDKERNVRIRAAFSIHKIDPADRTYVPVLVDAMREGDGRTLLEVAALGPDAAWAVPTLSGLLSHESPKVRTLAARALGSIGPAASAARPGLEAASRDSNAAVQTAATEALAHVQGSVSARAAK
jgi:HEAT repeat protein